MHMSTGIFFPWLFAIFCFQLQFTPTVDSANILFYLAISSYSHRIGVWPLVESLVERGHNITVLSPHIAKTTNPKVTEFNPKSYADWFAEFESADATAVFDQRQNGEVASAWFQTAPIIHMACEKLLEDQVVLDWLNSAKYDLVVIDTLFNECALGFAHKFGASTILYSTTSLSPWLVEQFGLQVESSWIPDMVFDPHSSELGFLEKAMGTLSPLIWYYFRGWFILPKLEEILNEKLPGLAKPMPSLEELEQSVSLLFINAHFSEEYARSLPPFVVPVGGALCYQQMEEQRMKKGKLNDLPKDLEEFIRKSKDGFIYVSFGTYADVFDRPELQVVFLETFRKMSNLRFIWKSNGTPTTNLPANVMLTKWAPQKDLLADKRIRAFITHGGLLSLHEAICNGVPLIVLPIFAEQDFNAKRIRTNGYGIQLELNTLTQAELIGAISEVFSEPKYTDNIKMASQMFKDRPSSPIETATWWTEYVLRNRNNTALLKPRNRSQTWYQRRLLDVWAFVFCTALAAVALIFILARTVFRFLFSIVVGTKNRSESHSNGKMKTS